MKVRDLMTGSVMTVRPEMSLKDAAAILAEHRIGGLPVVDDEGSVLGVVTDADIVLKEGAQPPPRGLRRLLRLGSTDTLSTKVEARTVGQAMSSPATVVEDWWSVASAAERMMEQGLNRLPVIKNGKLIGIITRHDLVRAFARDDDEIEQDIREEAFSSLARTDGLELRIEDGEVTLRGETDLKIDAEALPDMIRRIPGVVGVDSELSAWDSEENRQVVVSARVD